MQFTAKRGVAKTDAKAQAEGMKAETARRTDGNKTKNIYNMNTIRYYSKFGHTKSMVDAVKDLMDSEPRTVETPLEGKVDVLYIGAGVLMGKVDKRVMDFIATLTPETVGRVVCFGSCAIIKSPVPQMRKALEARGITVDSREFTCPGAMGPVKAGHPDADDIKRFREFVSNTLQQ